MDADTYLLAYMGVGSDGFITTFTIPANGSSITEVQTLEHDIYSGHYNSLVQVDADTYVLAYQGRSQDGWISTFTVSADGTSITEVASLEHDTIKNTWNSIVQVDADTYALASNNSGGGTITTFTISADGTSITEVASLVHDNTAVEHNSLCQVDSDTYVLAYTQGVDGDGFIKTFTISSDGATITEVDELEHDTNKGTSNSIVQVDSDTYALAYSGNGAYDGYIKTFTIQSDGTSITEVASLYHDTWTASSNSIVQVDSDTYAIAFGGTDSDGYIKTFTIQSDGS
ncbi:MAG: hypothetical protein COA98_08450, partial [Candidatus Neomarinimicrobiota bacterium]